MKTYLLSFFLLLSGVVFGQDDYVLNQTEKDSVWSAVLLSEKTQQLLKNYKTKSSEDILLAENQLSFISVLLSDLTDAETKKSLLINKIRFDKKRPLHVPPDSRVYPLGREKTIVKFDSKDVAVKNFITSYNDERLVNFSEMPVIFLQNNKKHKEKDTITSADKKIARIQKTKIEKLELLIMPQSTVLFSKKGIYGCLIVYYDK